MVRSDILSENLEQRRQNRRALLHVVLNDNLGLKQAGKQQSLQSLKLVLLVAVGVVAEHSKLQRTLLQRANIVVVLKLKHDEVVAVDEAVDCLQQTEELRLEVRLVRAV